MNAFFKDPLVLLIINAVVGSVAGVACGLLVALLIFGINSLISQDSAIYPSDTGGVTLVGMMFGAIIGSILGGVVGIRRGK